MSKLDSVAAGKIWHSLEKSIIHHDKEFSGSLGLIFLFIYMLLSTLILVGFWYQGFMPDTPVLILILGWVSFILVSTQVPGKWLLVDLLNGGNSHRFSKKYHGMGRIIGKYSSTNDEETREILRHNNSRWPYGGWSTLGEKFLVVELDHAGSKYRSAMKVSNEEFILAQPDAEVEISYQLARGPGGPGSPALFWLKTI